MSCLFVACRPQHAIGGRLATTGRPSAPCSCNARWRWSLPHASDAPLHSVCKHHEVANILVWKSSTHQWFCVVPSHLCSCPRCTRCWQRQAHSGDCCHGTEHVHDHRDQRELKCAVLTCQKVVTFSAIISLPGLGKFA
jgi:hypothetical protein